MDNYIFRVWDPANKRMIKPSFDLVIEFHTNPFGEAYICAFVDNKKIENAIVMQSTGFSDKNENLIFAGDIVKVYNHMGASTMTISDIFTFAIHFDYQLRDKTLEVIGNIHKNPELIANNSDEDLFAVEKHKEYLEEKRNIEAQEAEWNKTDWGSK